jgi:hypothetical protein
VERERAEEIWEAGREAVVEALVEAWAGLGQLTVALDGLRERIDELERQIDRDSTNSGAVVGCAQVAGRATPRGQGGLQALDAQVRRPARA